MIENELKRIIEDCIVVDTRDDESIDINADDCVKSLLDIFVVRNKFKESFTKEEFVTWEEVEDYIENISSWQQIWKFDFSGVYGLPRGGLVLAVMVSHKLNIPLLAAPCPGCLIIDDIADSGRSLIHYTTNDTQKNRYYISTMFYDERSSVKPDYYRYEKEGKWIVFPWELS